MKFQTTKKAMRNGSGTILSIGYCQLQTLLDSQNPIAYSAGTNGWACDYYQIDLSDHNRVIISTGYGPIGQDVDYKLVKEYEKKAEELKEKFRSGSWHEYSKAMQPLIEEFIKKAVIK